MKSFFLHIGKFHFLKFSHTNVNLAFKKHNNIIMFPHKHTLKTSSKIPRHHCLWKCLHQIHLLISFEVSIPEMRVTLVNCSRLYIFFLDDLFSLLTF